VLGFLAECDFGGAVDRDVLGVIRLSLVDGSTQLVRYTAAVRPGLGPAERLMFAEWAASRFARFGQHGAEPDGWQWTGPGECQLWGRSVVLPG
jgi:hypothetical protein